MNEVVKQNFSKLHVSIFLVPVVLVLLMVWFLFQNNALHIDGYIGIQKELFYDLNRGLSAFPSLQINLTHLGDALIILSILSVVFVSAPKLWEALIASSFLSMVISRVLKSTFNVPRPAQYLDKDSFTIIGKELVGFSSLPSGHSITVFTTLTVLLFALMPKKTIFKILWAAILLMIGLVLISTRVGIGAHFPLDTLFGAIIGFFSGLLGIFFIKKVNLFQWIELRKFYPVFIVAFVVCSAIIIQKILHETLAVYGIALITLFISIFIISRKYVQK